MAYPPDPVNIKSEAGGEPDIRDQALAVACNLLDEAVEWVLHPVDGPSDAAFADWFVVKTRAWVTETRKRI